MIKAVIFDMYETLITHYRCPLYFGAEMAKDAGIPEKNFQSLWRATSSERSTGKISFEEIIERILRENHVYSEEIHRKIIRKRIWTKEESFRQLHKEILPMLRALKESGMLIGLISNCFSEEAAVIKKSILYPYFDVPCLSWEEGLEKPDPGIFQRCLERMRVNPEECLYIGDGGSFELEAARQAGMTAAQAVWYLGVHPFQIEAGIDGFYQLKTPGEVLDLLP